MSNKLSIAIIFSNRTGFFVTFFILLYFKNARYEFRDRDVKDICGKIFVSSPEND